MNKHPFLFLIGGIFSLMIAMGIGRFAYTPILPLMQNALSFSDRIAGYLASSNYAGYLVGAILPGFIPLKNHKTMYLRLSLLISIITLFGMGLTHNYTLLLIFRFISGLTSAFIFVLASSIVLDKLNVMGKTNWSGIFYSGVGFGIFFSTLFIPDLNNLFNWEGVWIGLAVFSLILFIFVWMWLKDTPNSIMKKAEQVAVTQVPPVKWLRWLIIAYGLEGLGYIVTGTFIVSIAEKTSSFSGDSSLVWMIVGISAIPSCFLGSVIARKFGFVRSLVFLMILQSIGIALPVFSLSPTSIISSALLFGTTFMGITTLATTLASQISPTNSKRIIGYLTVIYAVGQMIGPTIAGVLTSRTQSYNSALLGAAFIVLFGAALLISGIQYDRNDKVKNINTSL